MSDTEYRRLLRHFSDRLVAAQRPIRILDAIKWEDDLRVEFFANNCRIAPKVDVNYYRDRPLPPEISESQQAFEDLDRELGQQLDVTDPAGRMMRRMCREYELVLRMLNARGTPEFSALSANLFGSADDPFHPCGPSLVELADLLHDALTRLDEATFINNQKTEFSAHQSVQMLGERLERYFGEDGQRIQVKLDDGIVADAAAGSDYIKIRAEARFGERDIRVLEVHEGWVHVGTTLNGLAQPVCTFLGKGTPSTTITQEGLALFVEVISFSSHPQRLRRVTDRIRAIHWAQQGAGFLEVFDRLCSEGRSREDAWPTCVRVYRGSTPTLGPFTKDLAYSRGFIEVYNFVRLAVRRGELEQIRLLFCGKLSLADMPDVIALAKAGIIEPARHLPPQFADPSALAAWMAYSNFLNQLDLTALAGASES